MEKINFQKLIKELASKAEFKKMVKAIPAKTRKELRNGNFKHVQLTSVFDIGNTTIKDDIMPAVQRFYRLVLKDILWPLTRLPLKEIIADFEKTGLKIKYNSSQQKKIKKKLEDYILDSIYNPPRYTKSRGRLYDFMETYFKKGEIKVDIFKDTLNKNSLLVKAKKRKDKLLCITRGTSSLWGAVLESLGLMKYIDKVYSIIPYGNLKNIETYTRFHLNMLVDNNYWIRAFHDDEQIVVPQLFAAGCLIVKLFNLKDYPFKVYWINRDQEDQEFIKDLEEYYHQLVKEHKLKSSFKDIFQINHNLIK